MNNKRYPIEEESVSSLQYTWLFSSQNKNKKQTIERENVPIDLKFKFKKYLSIRTKTSKINEIIWFKECQEKKLLEKLLILELNKDEVTEIVSVDN